MHDPAIAGAPLSALIAIPAPSIQTRLRDEMADAVANLIIDADAIEFARLDELVDPGTADT